MCLCAECTVHRRCGRRETETETTNHFEIHLFSCNFVLLCNWEPYNRNQSVMHLALDAIHRIHANTQRRILTECAACFLISSNYEHCATGCSTSLPPLLNWTELNWWWCCCRQKFNNLSFALVDEFRVPFIFFFPFVCSFVRILSSSRSFFVSCMRFVFAFFVSFFATK